MSAWGFLAEGRPMSTSETGALMDCEGQMESTLWQLLLRDIGKGANWVLKESSKDTSIPGELQLLLTVPSSPGEPFRNTPARELLAIQRHRN